MFAKPKFFWFCEELLEKFKNDYSVSQVCGRLEDVEIHNTAADAGYFLTSRGFIWGWATWRRTANGFDVDWINKHRIFLLLLKIWNNSTSFTECIYRIVNVFQVKFKIINSWAYPWNIQQLLMRRKCILPTVNQISNIGSGESATYTRGSINTIPIKNVRLPVNEKYFYCDQYTEASILCGRAQGYFFISSSKLLLKILIIAALQKLKIT